MNVGHFEYLKNDMTLTCYWFSKDTLGKSSKTSAQFKNVICFYTPIIRITAYQNQRTVKNII